MTSKRPEKFANIMKLIDESLALGLFRITSHAEMRMHERNIMLTDLKHVLQEGYHEKKKDEYHKEHNSWAYAVRGESIDRRKLRIIISFEEIEEGKMMLVVTVINLDNKESL